MFSIGRFLLFSRSIHHYRTASTASTFYHRDLIVRKSDARSGLPTNGKTLGFGVIYTDHMLEVDWTLENGWEKPTIKPFGNFSLHPAAKVLHYAVGLFEGVKAFRGVDDKIRIFRLDENMKRMISSARRASLPEFDGSELQKCIEELIRIDHEWVPRVKSSALYIRPTLIGTQGCLGLSKPKMAKLFVILSPVDRYHGNLDDGITLLADPRYVRAFYGGVGAYKLACNYAPTIKISHDAEELGCNQVLWLSGKEGFITEAGTMNIFLYWIKENGERELVTPPLDDLILPGVTRDSILTLAKEFNQCSVSERYITMKDIRESLMESRLLEMFGAGTAASITPISRILYRKDNGSLEELEIPTVWSESNLTYKLLETLRAIQRGKMKRTEWVTVI